MSFKKNSWAYVCIKKRSNFEPGCFSDYSRKNALIPEAVREQNAILGGKLRRENSFLNPVKYNGLLIDRLSQYYSTHFLLYLVTSTHKAITNLHVSMLSPHFQRESCPRGRHGHGSQSWSEAPISLGPTLSWIPFVLPARFRLADSLRQTTHLTHRGFRGKLRKHSTRLGKKGKENPWF